MADLERSPAHDVSHDAARISFAGSGTPHTLEASGYAFLLKLSDTLASAGGAAAIVETASRMLGEYLRADRTTYYSVEETADGFAHVVEQGVLGDGDVVHRAARAPWPVRGEQVIARLAAGRSVTVSDVRDLAGISADELDAWAAVHCVAFLAAPIIKHERYVAGLLVQYATRHVWANDEIALVEAVAARMSSALERARAEASLREVRRRLDETRATVRMGHWDWNPITDTLVVSPSVPGLFGLLPEQRLLTGVQGFAVVHPDDRAEHQARVEDAVRNGHGWHAEFRIVRPRDGEIVWIEERATVTRDQTTGACYMTGLAWDITDRKRAEAAADLERRLHARDGLRRQLLAAEEAERRRLARELHDQLGQQLTGMSLGLEEARRLAAGNDDRSGDDRVALLQRLERLQHLTRAMTTSARHLALELRPPELDDTGFENALDSYSAEWSTRFSVPSEVVIVGERDRALPSDVSSALYRIAQEALTNVAKHAKAASVSVIVEKLPAEVRLIIEDDGVGCDMEAAQARARRERRLGLAGIHERASILGGSAQIESSPGRGTTVFVRVPLGARFTPESNESVP